MANIKITGSKITEEDVKKLTAPVTVTDKATGKAVKSYNTTAEAIEAGVLGSGLSGKSNLGKNIFVNAAGDITTTPEVGIYIDEKTGKVTIKAPKSYYERESFKEQFSENSILKNYANNYAINKNVQYANEDDPEHPYSTADILAKWNEDLQNYASAITNQEKARVEFAKQGWGNLANKLTERDFAILATNGLGEEATDKTLIAVPTVGGLNFLDQIYKLKGFDKEGSFISAGDFKEGVYSLEKNSGEDLYKAYQALNTYARYLAGLESPTPEQVTEWARVQALLSYMTDEKASRGMWEEAKLWGNVVATTGQAGVAAVGETFTFLETIYNAATYLNPANWGKEWSETFGHSDIFYNATQKLNETMNQTQAELAYLDNIVSGANTIGRVAGTAAAIYGESFVANQLISATTNYLTAQYATGKQAEAIATATGTIAGEGELSAAARARAAFRSTVAADLGVTESSSAFMTATKSILALAKTDSSYLLNGTATLINMVGGAAEAAAAAEAVTLVANAAKAAKTAYIAGTMAGALSNIVVGTVALNGTTFRDYIATGNKELGKDLLTAVAWQATAFALLQAWGVATNVTSAAKAEQAATQAAAKAENATEATITSVAAGTTAFEQAQTATFGGLVESKAANANIAAAKTIVSTQHHIGAVKESIKRTVLRNGNYIQSIKAPTKRQAEEANAVIREAGIAVGLAEGAAESRDALAAYVAVQNAVDDRLSGVQNILKTMLNHKAEIEIATAFDEVVAAQQGLAQIEKRYNLPVRSGAGENTSLIADQYGFAVFRTRVINNAIAESGERTPGQAKELEHWGEIITDVEEKYPELADYIKDKQLPALYRLNNALLRYERAYKLRPASDLDFYETSKLWNGEYIHTQRVSEDNEVVNQRRIMTLLERRNLTTPRDQHYTFGSIEDPVSLYKSTMNRMTDIAIVQNSRNVTNKLTGYQGAKRKVIVNGEDYQRSKTITAINKGADRLEKQVRSEIKNLGKNESSLNLTPTVAKWGQAINDKAKAAVGQKKAMEKKAHANFGAIADNSPRLSVYKEAALQDLTQAETDALAVELFGYNFNNVDPDSFDLLLNGKELPAKARTAVKDYLSGELAANNVLINYETDLTYDNFVKLTQLNPNLPNELNKVAIGAMPEYKKHDKIISSAKAIYKADQNFLADGLLKESTEALQKAASDLELSNEELIETSNQMIEDFLGAIYDDKVTGELLEALVANEPDKELAKEFAVLWELNKNKRELASQLESQLYGVLEHDLARYNTAMVKAGKPTVDTHDLANKCTNLLMDMIWDRRNKVMNALAQNGSQLVKQEDIFKEIRDIQAEITGARSKPEMISQVDANGNTEIIEVDPLVADLINYRPTPDSYTTLQKFMRNKAFEVSHRLFRLSTTGVNLGSLTNQFFRDPVNAWASAGTTRGASYIQRDIELNFGAQIVADFEAYQPELFKHLAEVAEKRGVTIERQVVDYLAAQGEAIAETGTETAITRFAERDNNIFSWTKEKGEKVLEVMESPNEWRERGLRKADYARGVQRALRQGYNTRQAMEWGERTARDGTTEFGRMTVHLQAFTGSVPYLRAAINAPKSFYRMLSLDPIGVALRLFTGIFIPMVAGIISVVNDEEAKKQYKQLNEYEKDNLLIFNLGGSLVKIPIAQEAGQVLSPFRSLIEKLADANDKDLSLLMANDLLGFSPMNWPQDVLDIDGNILMDEATWTDRIGMGLLGAFSEMSPLLIKSVFEAIYGVDPFTGASVDKSYYTIDEDGNMVMMDSETSEFAQWLGNLTGWSPSIIAAALEDLIGQSATQLLDWGTSIATYASSGGEKGDPLSIVKSLTKQVTGKLTVNEYDRTKSRWNEAVRSLYAEKEKLMPGYIKYTEQINAETNSAKRKELIAKRQDYVGDYIERVKNTVDKMIDELGGSIDSYRFSSVVSLLNFYQPSNTGLTEYSRNMSTEMKYEAKEMAQRTIERMGIRNTIYGGDYSGQSLLGYYYQDGNGQTQFRFYTPLEILNAQSLYYSQQDIYRADIEATLKNAGIDRSKMFEGYYEQDTKAKKKAYKQEWNTKVIKTLAPYIDAYGAENIISNQETVDLLSRYIFVDNPYTAKQYLQKIFKGE